MTARRRKKQLYKGDELRGLGQRSKAENGKVRVESKV